MAGRFACQTFRTAVGLFANTGGVADVAAWRLRPAACSGAALLMSAVQGWTVVRTASSAPSAALAAGTVGTSSGS